MLNGWRQASVRAKLLIVVALALGNVLAISRAIAQDEWSGAAAGPVSIDPRSASLPFVAPRPGRLPADGAPTVGGVRLPAGRRHLGYWRTDARMTGPAPLLARLASAFPKTGLWPVLWTEADGDPDGYTAGPSAAGAVQHVDAEKVLRNSWAGYPGVPGFDGLAPAAVHGRPPLMSPFNVTPHVVDASYAPPGAGWVVMLVPVTRPADVIAVIGTRMTEYLSDAEISGVLRSWEERFAAVVVGVGPGSVDLAVGAPPRSDAQARRLAAEQVAFAPESDWQAGDDDLNRLARALRVNNGRADRSRFLWQFGWPD